MAGLIIGVLYLANYAVAAGVTGALGDQAAFVGRLAGAAVFGFVLVFIYYARAELTTSTMMMTGVGVHSRRISVAKAAGLLGLSMLGNALGGLVVAVLVRFSTILSGPTLELVEHSVATKLAYVSGGPAGIGDLFVRAVFCNVLINLAMLVVYKGTLHSDFGKIVALWSGIFVFVTMGYEHSVANTVLFTVVGLSHGIDVASAVAAVGVAFAGNLVGGAILIGLPYSYLNQPRPDRSAGTVSARRPRSAS